MATFGELQTRVQQIIIDLPTTVTAQVPSLIREVIKDLQIEHNFRIMEAEAAFTTATQTRVLGAVPDDWKEFRGKPYELTSFGKRRELDVGVDRAAAIDLYGSDDAEAEEETLQGPPRLILMGEPSDEEGTADFEVYPYSDGLSTWANSSAGQYRVRIPYWKFLTALSANGDSNWFTNSEVGADYIAYMAASEGFFDNWDEERGQVWATKALAKKAKLMQLDKRYRMSAMQALPYHFGARTPRAVR